MSQANDWKAERARARAEREQRRIERIMQSPLTRGENVQQATSIQASLISTALALESLELILVEKGVIAPDELMSKLTELVKERAQQAQALDATESPRIIAPV